MPTPQTAAKKNLLARAAAGFSGHSLRRPALTAFLCSLFVAAIFVLPFVVAQGGILYVSNDQITQQMPFTQAIVKGVRSGNIFYDFTLDLGSGFIEGYTWYNLGSIFTLPTLLFPAAATPYLLGPMLILKFGVAGLLAFLWVRVHTRTDLAALCGSMLCAFSGIALSNMVFPFADVYALFPLLPLAMDALMDGRIGGLFALAVALNALVNPPLFVGAVVFMVLYFAIRWLYGAYTVTLRRFARLLAESVTGLLLGAFILLPFVASLAANPRVGGTLPFGKDWFIYIAYRYFEILRSLVLPAEVIHQNSTMLLADAVSPELYLPLFALVPAFAYLLHKKRDWLKGLLVSSFVCLLVPVLNSAFNAFNITYYTRWVYMPVLAAALATALFLEQEDIPLKKGYALWGVFALAFAGCMGLWVFYFGYPTFLAFVPMFIVNLVICAAGLLATAASRRLWKKLPRLLVCGVGIFAIACGSFILYYNQALAVQEMGDLRRWPEKNIFAAEGTPLPEGVYRINAPTSNQYLNHSSPFSFTSTVPVGVFQLQAAFGRQRTSISTITYSEVGLWALLGVKYLLVPTADTEVPLPSTAFYAEDSAYSVVQNLDALPYVMGFTRYIPAASADALDNTQKSIAMLHGLVLDGDAASLCEMLDPIAQNELAALGYEEGVAARQAMAAGDVRLGNATLTATLTLEEDGAAFISLPYDAGWKCEINGAEVPLQKVHYGLMAAACPAGQNTITLTYRPVGGSAGAWLSLLGLACLAALALPQALKARRKGAG